MEMKQWTTKSPLGQGITKERKIKNFLEFNKNEGTT